MNVVYIKHFENGKKYVGITSNFTERMRGHEQKSKDGSNYLVHKAMRKYSHETEIVFESEDYDEVLKMEVLIIQNFKDLGYELYNMTNGGEGTVGMTHSTESKLLMSETRKGEGNGMFGKKHSEETKKIFSEQAKNRTPEHQKKIGDAQRGEKSKRAKDKDYYSKNPVQLSHFKRTCKRMGWNFEEFERIDGDYVIRPNGVKQIRYRFVYKGSSES